jgi:ferredoxin-NADP reductase
MANAKTFTLPFLKKEQLAKDTFSFFFDRSAIDFYFMPGQYIRMILSHENPDVRGTSRFFTIASSPHKKKHLMVTTKMIQSTFKETLHNLTPGTPVQFFGPMGKFLLDTTDQRERVFIAGGVGVTPFHSMLTYVAKKKISLPITLFVSFAAENEVIFYEELTSLTKKHNNLQVVYAISDKNVSKSWKGEKGRVSKSIIKKYITDFNKPIYSIVGSTSMVEKTKDFLLSLKISEEQIITEDFTGY